MLRREEKDCGAGGGGLWRRPARVDNGRLAADPAAVEINAFRFSLERVAEKLAAVAVLVG